MGGQAQTKVDNAVNTESESYLFFWTNLVNSGQNHKLILHSEACSKIGMKGHNVKRINSDLFQWINFYRFIKFKHFLNNFV